MSKEGTEKSYRSILKGTSIFGGVQIFNILINLIRGKFVAVILGPEGMGISSLFTSASATIQRFASWGLNQAIVRETASVAEREEEKSSLISLVVKLIGFTGLLGMVFCIVLCFPLSRLTFGSPDYAWQFVLLGLAVGLSIIASGKLAILQGLHQVKRISKASIVGGLTGLCVGVPLYYIWGDKGIVPAIVALALSMYVFYSVNLYRSHGRIREKSSWKQHKPLIKRLLLMGVVLMASDVIGSLVMYLLNLFLRTKGSLDDVGLYQAANSITNQYAGLVFAAMAMDYFPRLSKVADRNEEMIEVVNRQTEIVALLIAPAICLLILSAPLVIRVLLSEKFLEIMPLMRWMGLGVLLKAISFPMGYIAFAKGNKKVFFLLEGLWGNIVYLLIGCAGFYFYGLIGLGYALVADNLLSIIVYYIVNNKLYRYRFSGGAFIYMLISIGLGILCFGASLFESQGLSFTFMGVVTFLSLLWCYFILRRKLKPDLKSENDFG